MSAKMSPARRAAFLKALEATGNVTLSAERAKVSRRWAQTERKADPAFDAACRAALKASFDRLRMSGDGKPPRGWGYLDGVELVVRGSNKRRVQIARARLRQWTPRGEARFVAVTEATCNVRAACAAAGLSVASAYRHRERRPGFARRWDGAIAAGHPRLTGALTAGAIALLDPEISADEQHLPPLAPMNVDHAIAIAMLYERRVRKALAAEEKARRASLEALRRGTAVSASAPPAP